MNTAPATCPTADQSSTPRAHSLTEEESAHLREILKRCPAATYDAACQFRKTGDPRHLPAVIHGIIGRFVESALRARLNDPPDHLRLIEDLGLDSLTLMEIVILVEDVLTITVRNDELRPLRTLGDIRQFVEVKIRHHPNREPGPG